MMRRAQTVEIDQAYREVGEGAFGQPRRRVWRVERTYEGRDGIAYAQLTDPTDSTTKTIAQSTLLDRAFYVPVD